MYPENSNLIYAAYLSQPDDMSQGKLRESFVLCQPENCAIQVYCAYQGDFLIGDIVFEVGGKNKTKAQLKGNANGYVITDDILTGSQQRIPLYLLGFLANHSI